MNTASDIQITKNDDKYKIKVVIIGESTNKNYMNTYGYPLENTPFLSSVNGRFSIILLVRHPIRYRP
ncbi:hypothetical protein J4731_02150 [Providencia rettgeri]|nr:hypothetical protein [Providencia rettgeri]